MSFFGIYDGHGGKDASEFAAQHLHHNIFNSSSFIDNLEDAIIEGFVATDKQFEETGKGGTQTSPGCGSCAVVAILRETEEERELIVANLGDSRVVLAKQQDGELKAVPLSVDQTATSERTRLEEAGKYCFVNLVLSNNKLLPFLTPFIV
jgi:serine/threonine protein phosphatase PrpC